MILPKSKGALLVLLWAILMLVYEAFIIIDVANVAYAIAYLVLSLYFVVGLVADICIIRYKVIVVSIYCAFVGWICLCISFFIMHKLVQQVFEIIGIVVGCMGAAGVLTISIPFNIDQLTIVGASADELSVVIYWYIFSYPLGYGLANLSRCFISNELYRQSVGLGVSGVAITVVMVTYYLLKHHLDTTPLLTNPIKLIVKVLNYARKNKYPRLRSALTYWEESAPSRLDLGKDKYGGPFTEEEVEDVKTVLRFCPLMVCIFAFVIATIVRRSLHKGLNIIEHCAYIGEIPSVVTLLMMLLYKMFFSRFCHRCIPSMLKRIGLSLCIVLLALLVYIIPIDVVNYKTVSNCTTTLEGSTTNTIFIWSFQVLSDTGSAIAIAALLELTVAQSPVNMRGLMVGLLFYCGFVSVLLTSAISITLDQVHSHCVLYSHVTAVVCVLLVTAIYCVLARHYKLRVRNEVYNIHHVVATTYDRYIQQSDEYRQTN